MFAQTLSALSGGDEAAYQVVLGLAAACRNDPTHVLHQLLVAAPSLIQRAVIAAQRRHHRIRPALETLPVLTGIPSISAITITGRGQASSETRSNSVRPSSPSSSSFTISWMSGRIFCTLRVVNALLTRRLRRVCSGGSTESMVSTRPRRR